MNFKEYFEEKVLEDLFIESLIEEGALGTLGRVASAPFKFTGAAATNLGNQLRRGGWEVGKGLAKAGWGAGEIGLGALKTATFAPGKGFEDIKRGAGRVFSGAVDGVSGFTKAVGSLASAPIRGIQAATETGVGDFDPNANKVQKFFGLNSWRTPEEQKDQNQKEFNTLLSQHSQLEKTRKSAPPEKKEYINAKLQEIRAKMLSLDKVRFNQLRKIASHRADARSARAPSYAAM